MTSPKRMKRLDRREDFLLIAFAVIVPLVTLPSIAGF
jgi:hypothetical protein